MKWLLIGVLLFFIACSTKPYSVSDKERAASFAVAKKVSMECRTGATTYVQLATCENNERTEYFNEIGYEYMDLVDLYSAYYLALAARVDNGQMSKEDAQLVLALAEQELTSTEAERIAAKPNGWKQVWQVLSLTSNAYLLSRSYNLQITCTHNGTFIICK